MASIGAKERKVIGSTNATILGGIDGRSKAGLPTEPHEG